MRKVAFVISPLLAGAASAGPVRVDVLDDYFAWRRR